jgi:hypothetical protein
MLFSFTHLIFDVDCRRSPPLVFTSRNPAPQPTR